MAPHATVINKNGNIDGIWSKYKNDGSLLESKIYKNGSLIEVIK